MKNIKSIFSQFNNKQGFTLLEVIFAIFLIGIALTPALSVISYTIFANQSSVSRLIAANLAQEGIEVIRNMRDANSVWDNWYDGIINGDYRAQYNSDDLLAYSDAPLFLDTNGLYNYTSGQPTFFSRKISLIKDSNSELSVKSIVSWNQHGKINQIEVDDKLYNWR